MTKKYEIGSQWETRGGWRAVVVDVLETGTLRVWHEKFDTTGLHEADGSQLGIRREGLLRPWVEKRSGWVNIRCDDPLKPYAVFHETKEDADAAADYGITKRLACVKWTEGDGV